MHLKSDINIEKFLSSVQECEEDVFFETQEGDRYSLQSVLSQFVFSSRARDIEFLKSGTICFRNQEDQKLLLPYLTD